MSGMRASDREREATIRHLHDGRVEGRLSTETFEARIERALTAKSGDELRELTADGFVLTDLGSTNGTWLAGRRVGQVEVAAGDVVRLGDLPLRLR
jgi:hypothetical protein